MKIFIEGQKYAIDVLESAFDDPKFYNQKGDEGTIISVGYYHSFTKNELVYMLPKVFMRDADNTVFDVSKDDVLNIEQTETFKHKAEYQWIRQTSVYFYNSLIEFKRRQGDSLLIENSLSASLNTNLGDTEYSYLDILLTTINFYKKNKNFIVYKNIEYKSQQVNKTNWDKSIRKSLPLLNQKQQPIYTQYNNRKKVVDNEEDLLTYFLSIVHHFNQEHSLSLSIDNSFTLIKGKKFDALQQNGLRKLKKIKYRYFNDTLKKMYRLCEMYFSQTDTASVKNKQEEFISINNYNLVFEDMVDKLLSDPIDTNKTVGTDKTSITDLKKNKDGKIIDHIFAHESLLDTSNIFYIGDSKYYKSDTTAGKVSKYKQFTYAKNVIQYNIDLLNEKKSYQENIRYRDELTEGYNITPNFFIYGSIDDYKNFDNHALETNGEIVTSYHFKERLFDRDTLFVHQYKINFLYVLKAYSQFREDKTQQFRNDTKKLFRDEFVKYFSDADTCEFTFYQYTKDNHKEFVDDNFRELNGKVFKTIDGRLVLAKHTNDNLLLDDFNEITINENY